MNSNKKKRVVLDAILTALIIAAMFIQYTGTFLHEVIGFAFFAAVIVHLFISASWIKKTASSIGQGKASKRRVALSLVGVALAFTMIILGISSVAISTIFASAGFSFPFGEYAMWTTLHSISSYALCAIVVIHLAMHWTFIASVFKVGYNSKNRKAISATVYASAVLGAGALGVAATGITIPILQNNPTAETSTSTTQQPEDDTEANAPQTASSKSKKGKRGSSASSTSSSVQNVPSQPSGNGYNQGEETEEDSGGSGGICTLCHKGCALTSPQCNKPYAAGLVTTSQVN